MSILQMDLCPYLSDTSQLKILNLDQGVNYVSSQQLGEATELRITSFVGRR